MILPKDRYPKKKPRQKLTTRQRKAMASAFIEKMMAEIQQAHATPRRTSHDPE